MHAPFSLSDFDLIVFDINGTLAGSDNQISVKMKRAYQQVIGRGTKFTVASGLNLLSAKPFADELGLDLPMILTNGGILETRQGEIMFRATLPREVVDGIISIAEELGADLVIYIDNSIYIQSMTENIAYVYRFVIDHLTVVGEWQAIEGKFPGINKMLVADISSQENLDRLGEKFRSTYGHMIDVVRASETLVEVMPKDVNKASGLRRLAELLEIPMNRVMAFGDYDNDAEMLEEAGLGVAVGNASESAKAAAEIVIGSVDDDGPAEFLLSLID